MGTVWWEVYHETIPPDRSTAWRAPVVGSGVATVAQLLNNAIDVQLIYRAKRIVSVLVDRRSANPNTITWDHSQQGLMKKFPTVPKSTVRPWYNRTSDYNLRGTFHVSILCDKCEMQNHSPKINIMYTTINLGNSNYLDVILFLAFRN